MRQGEFIIFWGICEGHVERECLASIKHVQLAGCSGTLKSANRHLDLGGTIVSYWQVLAGYKFAVTLLAWVIAGVIVYSGPRRAPHLFLAFFLFLIGGSYTANGAATVFRGMGWAEMEGPRLLAFQVEMVFNVLDPIILLYFVSLYPQRNKLNNATLFLLLEIVAVYILWNVVRHPIDFWWNYIPARNGVLSILYAPPHRIIYNLAVILCYSAALIALIRSSRGGGHAEARTLPVVVMAFGIALLPAITAYLMDLINPGGITGISIKEASLFIDGLEYYSGPEWWMPTVLMIFLVSPLICGFTWLYLKRAHGLGGGWHPRTFMTMLVVAGAVMVWDHGIELLRNFFYLEGDVWTLIAELKFPARWLTFSVVVGYALLQTSIFNIQAGARVALAGGLTIALAWVILLAGAVLVAATSGRPEGQMWGSGTLVLFGMTLAGAAPMAWWISKNVFPKADDPDFLLERKLEVFRMALDDAKAGGKDPLHDRALVGFRKSLGLSDAVHARLVNATAIPLFSHGPQPVLPGVLLFQRYEIQSLAGMGASGRTWLAKDLALDRDVAIKHVYGRPDDQGGRKVAAYVREARAAGALRHPHLVDVYETRVLGPDFFLVMEYLPGGSLAHRLERWGPLQATEAVQILDGVLSALEAVHAKGILHRDVKPANILLAADGTPKLADFGVAQVPGIDGTLTRLAPQAQPGTPRYMAPEQRAGKAITLQADLYSAAAVACEVLGATQHPHKVPDGTGVSPELESVLRRALAETPEDRFPSARDFQLALHATPEAAHLSVGAS